MGVVMAVLLSSGCAVVPTQPAAVPSIADPIPARFATQPLDWEECGDGVDCATVTAPLDWDRPDDGRTIEIALARRPAGGARIASLLMNPGGPGVSGVDAVVRRWAEFVSPALADRFDLVSWDPRGVGRTAPVVCYPDPAEEAMWLYAPTTPHWRDDPAGWVAAERAKGRAYVEACRASTGETLDFIDTVSTVRDLDLLRAVLGDERLHYLGFSYGTQIGQRYLDRFPERVGRMVLDGVVDPSVGGLAYLEQQEAGFERALTRFASVCGVRFGPDCPVPAGTTAALAAIHELLRRFDEQPAVASAPGEDRVLTAMTVRDAIAQSLYHDDDWVALRMLLTELQAEPPITDKAFALADAYFDFVPGAGSRSNFGDALRAIDCSDRGAVLDPVELEAHVRRLQEVAPTFTLGTPPMPDPVCAAWPTGPRLAPTAQIRGLGVPPILVVATTGDPATPYAWGAAVAQRLVSARLVTHHGDGHTAYDPGGAKAPCVRDAVDRYLIDGIVPAADPHCGR